MERTIIAAVRPDHSAADYPEWAADDVDALDALEALVGGYAFVAAEQTIDEVYAELGIHVTEDDVHERIGQIADKVSADLRGYLRQQLADNERAGTWEPERVVLERMRGNPAARLTPPDDR